MNEKVQKFLEALKEDKALEEEFKKALEGIEPEVREDAAAEFARKKGFDINQEDLSPDGQEISLDELENVAGGDGACYCMVAGGGGGHEDDDGATWGCGCAIYGQGGDGHDSHANCFCVGGGSGG